MALTEDYDRIKMVDIVRLQQEKTRHPQVHGRGILFIWIFIYGYYGYLLNNHFKML